MNQLLLSVLLFLPILSFAQDKLEGNFHREYGIFTTVHEDRKYFVDQFKYGQGVFYDALNLSSVTHYDNNSEVESYSPCGLIDSTGKVLLKQAYDKISIVNSHVVRLTKDKKHWLYDTRLKKDISKKYNVISYFQDRNITLTSEGNLYGLIDLAGNEILKCEYTILSPYDKDVIIAKKDEFYGCFTVGGELLLPFIYKDMSASGHYIFAKKDDGVEVYDKKGKMAVFFNSKRVKELTENILAVEEHGRTYMYDLKNNKRISTETYLEIADSDFDRNRDIHFLVFEKDGLYSLKSGFINVQGDIVLPVDYKIGNFREGFASIGKDERYGFIDENKKIVVPLMFDRVWNLFDGTAKAIYQGKNVYIDTKGKILFESDINPETMKENMGFFFEGMAVKTKNGKSGFVDRSGREIIPLLYDNVHAFRNGAALVSKDQTYFFIDKKGKRIE
ncbi:hypothetical protein ASG01_14090 [Chryseobacterium sp. Leaf180]|uniref:WG repeat-containing protein n=1 Tax=Chryseobacterium sp. Leaf180 TaxID=1736289 RepID=UPI000700F11D|nr:WG repeat-containing protein [Chryseobacterium sp. Leaf180]KQR91495.1 hypothetical protein ASG01_14090 [Chryseobacterium sp. Leaf180]